MDQIVSFVNTMLMKEKALGQRVAMRNILEHVHFGEVWCETVELGCEILNTSSSFI